MILKNRSLVIKSEVREPMRKTARDNAQSFLSRPSELFQVQRFVDRIMEDDWHDLRRPRIVPKSGDAVKRLLTDDRRKYERRKVDHVISYLELPLNGRRGLMLSTAFILDISEAGMCIRTARMLQPGDILLYCERPVYCRGVVRWCATIEAGAWHKAGIQFLDRSGDD